MGSPGSLQEFDEIMRMLSDDEEEAYMARSLLGRFQPKQAYSLFTLRDWLVYHQQHSADEPFDQDDWVSALGWLVEHKFVISIRDDTYRLAEIGHRVMVLH